MNAERLAQLLGKVKDGSVNIDEAIEELRHLPFEDLGFARIDHHREIRCGFPEVIFCPGKTTEQIVEIFGRLAAKGNNVLASLAGQEVFDALAATGEYEGLRYDSVAKMVVLEQKAAEPSAGFIAIVTAGTSDLPIAQQAKVTAEAMGQRTKMINDAGVAGIHRLLGHSDTMKILHEANVVIVIAGMEGALASVVGGLVDCPVIAVPTSVGYGASFDGLAALLAMLNSCASGITVVNIDNGFGAAYAASLINRKITRNAGNNAKGGR